MGPRGGLLQVGQGQVPVAERHLSPGAAEVGFGELGVAPQRQRPFRTAASTRPSAANAGAL